MILLNEGFANSLREAGDYRENPRYELDVLLADLPEEEKESRTKDYLLDLRIMKATTLDEIADITLEQILDCLASSNRLGELFEKQKAGYYFERFDQVRSIRTLRKRRVL